MSAQRGLFALLLVVVVPQLSTSLQLTTLARGAQSLLQPRRCAVVAALDYKDPAVAKEFAACQQLDTEEVEDELAAVGIPVPPTMNDMDMRMMLVEMRMRKAGKISDSKPAAKKPPPGASVFETALYEKPAFKALYDDWNLKRNTNALNLAAEYLNDPRKAKQRYGSTAKYDETVATIDEALNAKVEQVVTSGKIAYSGFPANMGEAGVKMTLGAFGELVDFSCEDNDDGLTCSGRAEFSDPETAKAAIDKYDGMDMGLGTKLDLQAL